MSDTLEADPGAGGAAGQARYPDIGEYAIIGDCRTAALVCSDGGVDWLCYPNFSGPAVFAALLDRERGGRFVIQPTRHSRMRRRYLPNTAVLETIFETDVVHFGYALPEPGAGWFKAALLRSILNR